MGGRIGRSLYSRVMAMPVRKSGPNWKAKPAKPRIRGKTKAKKLQGGKAKQRLRWFEVALGANAGRDPSHKRAFYKRHLKKLSKTQRARLRRRMERIRRAALGDSRTKAVMEALLEKTEEALHHHLLESEALLLRLKERIVRRIRQDRGVRFERKKGSVVAALMEEVRVPVDRYIREGFAPLVERYNTLVEEGVISPPTPGLRGRGFIKSVINDYCAFCLE